MKHKSLREIEQEKVNEVKDFYANHPEMWDGGVERSMHERHWVADRNLTTFPIDPDTMTGMNLGSLWPATDPRTPEQEQLAEDVEAAFKLMNPRHVDLLLRRYVESMTLDAIAAEENVTRQAIIKRLQVAEKNLREAMYAVTEPPVA